MAYSESPPPYPGLVLGENEAIAPTAPSYESATAVDDPLPWHCEYCGQRCTREEGGERHWATCTKFPEPCPNSCEVGSVERCDMEQHRSVCSLEPVACEMKEFGCNAVVPRRELARHMRESEIQHLTAMTMLNLRLTRLLQRESLNRDWKIAQLQRDIGEMRDQIETIDSTTNHITQHIGAACSGSQVFTFFQYKKNRGTKLAVFTDPFYSHHRGYKFQVRLRYEPAHIAVWLYLPFGEYDGHLHWPLKVHVNFKLLNQAEDHDHIERLVTGHWTNSTRNGVIVIDKALVSYTLLERQEPNGVQYILNDSIKTKINLTLL